MAEAVLKSTEVSFWTREIDLYERKFGTWERRSKKINKRYKDETENRINAQFNILWSNVQTLVPASYANPPKPNIDRRFQDDDELGNVSAQVLERSTSYFIQEDRLDTSMRQAVLDRFLCGRGQVWVRYVPNIQDNVTGQITEDAVPVLVSEDLEYDYVHWQDFGHTWARTWQEVRAVWRKVYMDRAALESRFGEAGKKLPLDGKVEDDKNDDVDSRKACVYEIWDSKNRKVYWVSKNAPECLDIKDDPLRLADFFPCPRPMYATIDNSSLVPTPDFVLYQDQAIELDLMTARISSLVKALKVTGVYDSSAEGVQRLLSESSDNKLIPVANWAIFGEKGGLKGVVDFFPLDMVVNTLTSLYQARDKVKQDIYEITGISDIVRGATNANETATAQQIKGQFAQLRLGDMQKEVARFGRDLVRISAEIIAEHFSLDTLKQISGIKLLSEQEKQQIAMLGQTGLPVPEQAQEILMKPTWEEVEATLRDDAARSFRIDIETDSTIKSDEEAEKQARIEFLGAVGGFVTQAIQVPKEMQPLMLDLLEFGVRGFRVGRELETSFKMTADKIKKSAEQPQEAKPDPEAMKMQADAQIEAQKVQADAAMQNQRLQADMQIEQQKIEADIMMQRERLEAEVRLKEIELQLKYSVEREKAMIEIAKQQESVESAMEGETNNEGE